MFLFNRLWHAHAMNRFLMLNVVESERWPTITWCFSKAPLLTLPFKDSKKSFLDKTKYAGTLWHQWVRTYNSCFQWWGIYDDVASADHLGYQPVSFYDSCCGLENTLSLQTTTWWGQWENGKFRLHSEK